MSPANHLDGLGFTMGGIELIKALSEMRFN
jgi:hypothetical protein